MNIYRWHEQSNLKNLYKAEIDTLKNGLGGDFKLLDLPDVQTTQGVVTAVGRLKYSHNKFQNILISFPTKYPYESPKLIALNITDQNGRKNISPQFYGRGNQYSDGQMCLLSKREWQTSYGIGFLLRKAQKWLLAANSKEGFKKEEIVEEIPIHIPHNGQVLFPCEFNPNPNLFSGSITLTKYKPNHYLLSKNIISNDPFKLTLGDEQFTWYRGPDGVEFKNFLKNASAQELVKMIKNIGAEEKISSIGIHNLAVFLPDSNMKWHFFKINVEANGSVGISYYISKVISQELYLRIKDIFSNKFLQTKRITIIGLGAIGSEVAVSLAKNGIGNFHIIDNDTFEVGNSIRHAADLFYIGETKTEVVKQLINRVNPNITVNTHAIDVLHDNGNLEQSLNNSDLCLILTGEDSVDYMINDIYTTQYNIPFVFAGVSIGGLTGGIEIVRSDSACLRCIGLRNLNTLPEPKEKVLLGELGPEYGNCSGPALPGSEIDIKEVAMQVSRIAIQLLLDDKLINYPKSSGNYYRWHGPFGSKNKQPFAWEIKNILKSPECGICNIKS